MAAVTGQRNTRTEARIKAAFTELLRSKGFDAMSVSDIARTAGINRGTFYMHYTDKFDLRTRLVDDAVDDLTRILIDDADRDGVTVTRDGTAVCDAFQSRAIAQALRYIRDDYAFFDAISRSGNDMQLYDRLKKTLKQLIVTQATHLGVEPQESYNGIPADYAMEILVSAVSSIIWLWLRRGCRETPEQICAIIERNKTTAPTDILW
ncbi:TetR/AcrR family transcriptional regulator [Bifidobacterium samirii]|uniref:TetR family transcriptional regulator n=1 Tax=Bifidobacterium samirii TaxID=2306974 RepID=A0A430FJI0_9BIFI|nr:TetR/AcrR family transcriptional regulator [Bifidobacterium samirii]RSX52977.1 TetR family transcriptional regulator [Bifidobacterium samirii]